MILSATDDYVHSVGPEPNFNESMYFHFHDPIAGLGGFLRLAKRPNEGRGERTVCLYLPDGSVAFGFERPNVDADDSFRGAGLAVEIVEPFQHLRVTFEGTVNLLPDPAALRDPRAALATTPRTGCTVTLDLHAAAPPYAETFDGDGESFAPNHYEQLTTVTGAVTLGDKARDLKGSAYATTPGAPDLGRHRTSTDGCTAPRRASDSWARTSAMPTVPIDRVDSSGMEHICTSATTSKSQPSATPNRNRGR